MIVCNKRSELLPQRGPEGGQHGPQARPPQPELQERAGCVSIHPKWEGSQTKQSGLRPGLQMLLCKINSFTPRSKHSYRSAFSSPLVTLNPARVKRAKTASTSIVFKCSYLHRSKAKKFSIAQLNHDKWLHSSAPANGPSFMSIPARKEVLAPNDMQ